VSDGLGMAGREDGGEAAQMIGRRGGEQLLHRQARFAVASRRLTASAVLGSVAGNFAGREVLAEMPRKPAARRLEDGNSCSNCADCMVVVDAAIQSLLE
jgi:hypothetical protein